MWADLGALEPWELLLAPSGGNRGVGGGEEWAGHVLLQERAKCFALEKCLNSHLWDSKHNFAV